MTHAQIIGRAGEKYACSYLLQKNYCILERNWRYKRYEIDIIAKYGRVLVAFEVKTRKASSFGPPESHISKYQWARIASALGSYMDSINHTWEVRFDIIALTYYSDEGFSLNHYEDVYFPGRNRLFNDRSQT